jgi:hypothetical protein
MLRYVFVDGTPWPGIPADMKTSGYIAGADRPLPHHEVYEDASMIAFLAQTKPR